ncbi:GntR family transcriptional regulator [Streptomyces griseocarneus]|uniref:GntR family transcriptional regulator n=1 Tax=Streptomyces griseocarneus TaxID=51201 RepID=UPI00167CBE8A|nr:GntR family transcriptional regulator [Streptomyces griseocarneus]MBZ6473210.1 GntR family transcriptional regulator [Streptomyces griseocarneus]GHG60463.1 transcriptional regulator [Streptomyces griseocarneus]
MAKAYERIADDLRESIRAGQLGPGERLPSETVLAEEYGRSVPTIREALRLLRDEGLIEKQHGRGNFVRQARTTVRRTNLRHQWEKDRARESEAHRRQTGATEHDTGLQVNDLVFRASYRETTADKDLAEAFGVPEGHALLERTYRTRYAAERAPFTLVTSYLVHDIVAANPDLLSAANEPWPGGTQNQLFTVGIELDRIEERVSARPPTPEEAEELDLPPGTAVILLRKTSYDINDRVVEISDVTLPGDRTELFFTTPLERW